MNKRQYMSLIKKPFSEWSHEDCIGADAHIRRVTLKNVRVYCRDVHAPVADFLEAMIRCHFGSVEVDELLTRLNLYPSYMHTDFMNSPS